MTDELIALLKAAKTDEERKAILDKHAKELTDEDLDSVAGGCGGSSCREDNYYSCVEGGDHCVEGP